MDKKNILPQQNKPVVRPTVAKLAISVQSEEQLTAGWNGGQGVIALMGVPCAGGGRGLPFAGDDAE